MSSLKTQDTHILDRCCRKVCALFFLQIDYFHASSEPVKHKKTTPSVGVDYVLTVFRRLPAILFFFVFIARPPYKRQAVDERRSNSSSSIRNGVEHQPTGTKQCPIVPRHRVAEAHSACEVVYNVPVVEPTHQFVSKLGARTCIRNRGPII